MVEGIHAADRAPQRQITGEEDVGPIEAYEQEAARRPWPDSWYLGQGRFNFRVGHSRQRIVAQAAVEEALCERSQRGALPGRHAAVS